MPTESRNLSTDGEGSVVESTDSVTTSQVLQKYNKYIDDIGGIENAQRGDVDNVLMALALANSGEKEQPRGSLTAYTGIVRQYGVDSPEAKQYLDNHSYDKDLQYKAKTLGQCIIEDPEFLEPFEENEA